jgi:uncharacterized NAD-dependent epimerase/dehydratase family protein
VVADFVSGAAEKLVLQNQHLEILLIEGQGSLVHPSYSGVTLSLLHGCFPHGLIMCYEVGRKEVAGIEHVKLPSLSKLRQLYESLAGLERQCPVIGVAMNSRRVSAEQAESERRMVGSKLDLPVVDVFRHGADELVEAVLNLEAMRKV